MSIRYSERLDEAGINPSVGSTGDAYDNALAETINRLYKTEVIYKRGPWKTKAAVELATLEWVSWFNHQRLLESIGDIPPAEAEQRYYQQLAVQAAEPALSSLDVRSYATAKAPSTENAGRIILMGAMGEVEARTGGATLTDKQSKFQSGIGMRVVKLVIAVLFGVACAADTYHRPGDSQALILPFVVWSLLAYALLSGIQALWRVTAGGRRVAYVARGAWRRGRSRASKALSELERDGK